MPLLCLLTSKLLVRTHNSGKCVNTALTYHLCLNMLFKE
jgi:hypothetical protein